MSLNASKGINKLVPHAFYECSDLPALPPLFSCSACDAWRERIHNKGSRYIVRRDFLNDRHQCTRAKQGRGPIRVRVVCLAAALANPRISSATTHALLEEKSESIQKCQNMPERRSSRIRASVSRKKMLPASESKIHLSSSVERVLVTPKIAVASKRRKASDVINRLNECKKAKEAQLAITCSRQEKATAMEMLLQARAVEAEAEQKLRVALSKEAEMRKAAVELKQINQQVEHRKQVLADYEKELKNKRELNRYYNKLSDKSSFDDVSKLVAVIEGALIHLKGKHSCTKAKLLMEAIVSGNLFNGEAAKLFQEKIRGYIKNLFRPWKLVKASDVAAVGAFKSSTIDALRTVIDEQKEDLFPSNGSVCRVRRLLDEYGFEKVGWERRNTQFGEVFYINFEKALRLLLKACELDELATRTSVKVALTVDGADLFRGRTHVSTGIKITDERGIHPVTKQPLSFQEESEEMYFVKVQSSELCCVMIIADAVDSKEIYSDVFREYYDWGESIRRNGLPESALGPKLMPFQVLYCNDLKGTWYLTCKGGGCKNKTFFCHLCACTKDTLTDFKICDDRCARCLAAGRSKCYHHQVCDKINVRLLLDDLQQQIGIYYEKHGKHYDDIIARSRLLTNHMQGDKESDQLHIDYVVPPMDDEKQKQYANFIARECIIRGLRINSNDNFEVWRSMLRETVAMEKYISYLQIVRKWNDDGRDKVPLIEVLELLIPCILHLENRVGEKMITTILRKGLDLSDFGSKEEFIRKLQHTLQTKIFGTETSPSQWKLRYDKEPGTGAILLETIQLRNNASRCCVNSIDKIIESAFINNEPVASKLLIACTKYQEAMKLLTSHRELSVQEIEAFQSLIDDFYELWIEVFGSEGITNYIHMLGSGHIMYFLKEYKCLYLYSQQGWEALNGKIQTFIHQNSQRGGHNSGVKKGEKSYIYAVVRMVIRDLLWKTYEADKFYLDLERKGLKC